jgi:hypothetical protein
MDAAPGDDAVPTFYDALAGAFQQGPTEQEPYLSFGLLPAPDDSFSFLLAYAYPDEAPERYRRLHEAQRRLRDHLFAHLR